MINTADEIFLRRQKSYSKAFSTRIRRALSWLKKERTLDEAEYDLRFITLWIAFNAVYGKDLSLAMNSGDKISFREFINKITTLDGDGMLNSIVWGKYSGRINFIMENQYTYQKYWDYLNGDNRAQNWEGAFKKSIEKATECRMSLDTDSMLSLVFDRLYTIRNQLLHGGASYGSDLNREMIEDSLGFMRDIIPAMIVIMENNYEKHPEWGKPFYLA